MTNRHTVWVALFAVPLLYYLSRMAPQSWHFWLGLSLHWIIAAMALVWAHRELPSPKGMGLNNVFSGFGCFVAVVVAYCVGINLWFGQEELAFWQWSQIPKQLGRSGYFLAAISAGFCEEVIYRGYMMTALKRAGQKPWIAMVLSTLSFVFFHGWLPIPLLIAGFFIGMIWAAIAHKTSILWITIYFHAIWDVSALLIPWASLSGGL